MNSHREIRSRSIHLSSFLLPIAICIIFLDQVTKGIVYLSLPVIHSIPYAYPYGGIGLFRDLFGIEFSLNHMTNAGAAWGLFGGHQLSLLILRILLICGLLLYLFCFNHEKSRQFPLMLIIAGAIGNVLDFFIYGHVIDMFHFMFKGVDFPIFSIADAAISIGIGWLFLISFMKKS